VSREYEKSERGVEAERPVVRADPAGPSLVNPVVWVCVLVTFSDSVW